MFLTSSILFVTKGTNIHDSLVEAAVEFTDKLSSFPVIVFMTDGVPSVGETNPDKIVDSVTKAIAGNAALYCVGFGDDVDEFLLKRLAAGNGGAYRKVADDDNAAAKMEGFFREVASPLLYYIRVTYNMEAVVSGTLTQSEFISYFGGEEIVIAGQLDKNYDGGALSGLVLGNSVDGLIEHDFYQDIRDVREIFAPLLLIFLGGGGLFLWFFESLMEKMVPITHFHTILALLT